MNLPLSIFAGGCVGWAAFAILGLNQHRGTNVSVAIGAITGGVGGQLLAPMLAGSTAISGAFSFDEPLIAALSAAACLLAANVIHKRFGI